MASNHVTLTTIRLNIREIERLTDDTEAAHELEDKLFVAVLEAVAAGAPDAALLAAEALKSKKIKFGRYCG